MPTPNNMPKVSAEEREYQAYRAKMQREAELDALPKVTESKAYRKALRKAGIR
jgi:hypothetical protein